MKKFLTSGLILFLGTSGFCMAGSGNANDGLMFILVLLGILVMIVLILHLIDLIRNHPGNLKGIIIDATVAINKMFIRILQSLRNIHHRSNKQELINPYPSNC